MAINASFAEDILEFLIKKQNIIIHRHIAIDAEKKI